MKLNRKTLIVAATLGATLVASPAFAWTCTAKDARGALFVGVGVIRAEAMERAMAKCFAGSVRDRSCVIINCG